MEQQTITYEVDADIETLVELIWENCSKVLFTRYLGRADSEVSILHVNADGIHYAVHQFPTFWCERGGEYISVPKDYAVIDGALFKAHRNKILDDGELGEGIGEEQLQIRLDFQYRGNGKTVVLVTSLEGIWKEYIEYITYGWERIDEQPAAATEQPAEKPRNKGGRRQHRSNIWLIKQHLDDGVPLLDLKTEWLEMRRSDGKEELADTDDSMKTVISEERERRNEETMRK